MAPTSQVTHLATSDSASKQDAAAANHLEASGKMGVLTADQDEAWKIFGGGLDNLDYAPHEEARVRWKLDLILMPMMVLTYVLCYMDKVALSEASVFGIQKDLGLVGQQYNWSSSIFYLGYVIWQYPSSVLMQRLPIGRYFGCMIFLWGITTASTAFTTNFTTLCVDRVFLGVFETCMNPILTILVGQYWTRDEHSLRTSIWWSGSAVGAFIADAISYGVSGQGFSGSQYSIWQIIYLVFGPITIAWGVLIFCAVPSSPMKAWFLTERERKIATTRLTANRTGVLNNKYKINHVKECLKDPQAWLLAINAFLQCIQGGGLTSFSKVVLTTGLGFSSRQSTLMGMPSNAIHLVSVILAGWFCSRYRNTRCYMMIATNVIVLIGAVLIDNLPASNHSGRLAAFYILYVNTVPFGLGMSMISSNVAGFTKKATASVLMFVGYCLGQFCGPLFFIASEAPYYPTAFRTFYASVSLMIGIELMLVSQFQDLTDWEQPQFRYHEMHIAAMAQVAHDDDTPRQSQNTMESKTMEDDWFLFHDFDASELDIAVADMSAIFGGPEDVSVSDPGPVVETSLDLAIPTPSPITREILAALSAELATSINTPSPSTVSISDHVLAQHYKQKLTGRYSSKDPAWNYYVHFYNRFSSSHPFVLSALYAWTSAHLFCTGILKATTDALSHYHNCLAELQRWFGLTIDRPLDPLDSGLQEIQTTDDDTLDAITVGLYFLASTDLMLGDFGRLRRVLDLEAEILLAQGLGPQRPQLKLGRLSTVAAMWFCYLDARTASFGMRATSILQAMGGESGMVQATGATKDLLRSEYSPIYPSQQQQRDEVHLPLLKTMNRLTMRHSLSEIREQLNLHATSYSEDKRLPPSSYYTTSALYHGVEIYLSRMALPAAPLHAADAHGQAVVRLTEEMYRTLNLPRTEPPPTKMWPIPLTLAAIETSDAVYRSWAMEKLHAYTPRAGAHYASSVQFAEKVSPGPTSPSSRYYQHIIVHGLPYDRGYSHGTQLRTKIHANIAYYKLPGKLPHPTICAAIIRESYLPALEAKYPTGLDEMRGIAAGAEVPLEDIVMLNARYDLARCMYLLHDGGRTPHLDMDAHKNGQDECTGAFFAAEVIASGHDLAVHNWDMSSHLHDQDLIIYLEVRPHPSERQPAMFILTEAGQLIRSGINTAGLAVTANSLLCSTDHVPLTSYLGVEGTLRHPPSPSPTPTIPISLARRVFLEHTNYATALSAVHALPRHVSGNLTLCSAGGAAICLELTPGRTYKFYGSHIDDNYLVHSNHFLSPSFGTQSGAVFDRSPGGSTWFRNRRAEQRVRAACKSGLLTKEHIRAAFSDHFGFPHSLCQHADHEGAKNGPSHVLTGYTSKLSMTVAFVIYDLTERKITVCKGTPCEGFVEEYSLKEKDGW
ncbi:uncharacterized protein B0I36DRAFT_293256 [Microdochium trichocladiopsis]|uniref:Major facilitator superfamily (MFS) profile domain-containing protein n=1 Tax=Microdochium trichocladiopsis TaxID=1682393 RepID=A0A9P8XXX7_9PEZI|nr:uncharacterized protein B0I36DRAFT_293256 [Microdochium trichocladiopsis]KAH7025665.1 hypothetical protein B0I36DRAFT_293256 [Microdochium trichocladiopsis]